MKTIQLHTALFILPFFFFACSSSEQTVSDKKEEVYVFDSVPADTSLKLPEFVIEYPSLNVTYYVVQIGAFTTRERAEKFSEDSRKKLGKDLTISFSNNVNLFVVQLSPLYTSRQEAEKMRNYLWTIDDFKDAWILTVSK
jgi:hypothetical protein